MRFIAARQQANASNGEINRELAVIRRAHVLGRKAKKIEDAPPIEELIENNVRKGSFERGEFEAVARNLTPQLASLFRFAYVTGWCIRSEVMRLQ